MLNSIKLQNQREEHKMCLKVALKEKIPKWRSALLVPQKFCRKCKFYKTNGLPKWHILYHHVQQQNDWEGCRHYLPIFSQRSGERHLGPVPFVLIIKQTPFPYQLPSGEQQSLHTCPSLSKESRKTPSPFHWSWLPNTGPSTDFPVVYHKPYKVIVSSYLKLEPFEHVEGWEINYAIIET